MSTRDARRTMWCAPGRMDWRASKHVARNALGRLACAALFCAVWLSALPGCTTAVPVAERTLAAHPTSWVAVVPRTVRASPEFARLVETRKAQFTVEVVEYDADAGTPEQRLQVTHAALQRVDATIEGATGYILLIGGPDTLPMGPWTFEGVDTPILTDFPLGAVLDTTIQPIPAAAWRGALEREPRWIVGRIPYDEPALAVRVIGLSFEQMRGATATRGSALLGAGGISEAWLLASARHELHEQHWTAALAGSAGSCDTRAPDGILPVWDEKAPQLVVLAGQIEPQTRGGGLVNLLPGASARDPIQGTAPALLAAFAGEFGQPNNEVLRSLFEDGWSAGAVAFTAPISASPLGAAWRMSVLLPADLASGAPIGNSTEASRRRYWAQAGKDIGILLPGTERWRALNALSAVVYGDPALRAAGSAEPSPASDRAAALPLVVDASNTEAPHDGSATTNRNPPVAETSSQPQATTLGVRWLALGALAVFLAAVFFWLFARRSDRTPKR